MLNGGLKPEHKKTTNMVSPTTDIDSQAPTIWNTGEGAVI